ncbi:pyridoxal-dependent decarboxylase [Candidatus Rhodoblastus alkanivorans]|uniref:pyridoxal-dependent decarboxylase n=1 Tax=Candidatus Rhodoblastus alkanivorans TaxID=2954117 RepID=UPI003F6E0C12
MHVDAASGGCLAPFCAPDLVWDFRLPRVKSISASGHKFGLAPLGVGWILWRDKKDLPDDLVFKSNYLGGEMPTFAINFSRPAGQINAQYDNFIRLGRDGNRKVYMDCHHTAQYLAHEIAKLGPFDLLCDGDPEKGLPAVTWKIKEGVAPGYTLFDLADRLRVRGWQVPAYTLPSNLQNVPVQRILVRQGLTRDLAQILIDDLRRAIAHFAKHPVNAPMTEAEAGGFNHGRGPSLWIFAPAPKLAPIGKPAPGSA